MDNRFGSYQRVICLIISPLPITDIQDFGGGREDREQLP